VSDALPRTPSFHLDERRALVTGAGRGIGLAAPCGGGGTILLCSACY
jgi:hypothetical protein